MRRIGECSDRIGQDGAGAKPAEKRLVTEKRHCVGADLKVKGLRFRFLLPVPPHYLNRYNWNHGNLMNQVTFSCPEFVI
jgi:hypothetical protein